MFSLSVVDTDQFLEMPITSRLLYYELGMRADDDGFVDNWKKILLFTGLKEDDLKILIVKKFIIPFESGIIVIRHWRLNNYLQNDRTKPTIHQEELKQLSTDNSNVYNLYTDCIHSIDKYSIDKNSINKNIYGEFKNVLLAEDEYEKIKQNNLLPYIEKLSSYIASKGKKYKSHYATILNWARKETATNEKTPEWFKKEVKKEELTKEDKEELDNLLKEFN